MWGTSGEGGSKYGQILCERGFLGVLAVWESPYVCGSAGPHKPPGTSRDTLNPKMLPCSCRSLLSRVLFPAPEGPLRTTGLGPDIPVGEWEQISAGLRDPGECDGCSHNPPPTPILPANSPQESELRAILKPWLHLPDGWATWYLPSCALLPHLWSLDFPSWERHIWVPTRHFLGTMP